MDTQKSLSLPDRLKLPHPPLPHLLVDGSPQIMLLAVDLYEGFVNVERITIAAVLSLQAPNV